MKLRILSLLIVVFFVVVVQNVLAYTKDTNPPANLCGCLGVWSSCKCGRRQFQGSCEFCPAGRACGGYNSYECTPGHFGRGKDRQIDGNWVGECCQGSPCLCTACRAGTFQAQKASSHCWLSPRGTFVANAGATSFSKCQAGRYQDQEGSSKCKYCSKGYWSAAEAFSCNPCAAGTYSTVPAATSSATCLKCAAGTYSAQVAADSASYCVPCVAGTYSTYGSGATSSSVCQKCVAGTYSNNTLGATSSSLCIQCSASTYSTTIGAASSSVCKSCSSGYFSAAGATQCTICSLGHYCSSTSGCATKCQMCLPGYYVPYQGSYGPIHCSKGTYSTTPGATSSSSCKPCAVGSYSSTIAATSCNKCPIGTFSETALATSASVCLFCPPRYGTSVEGSTTCSPCPRGSTSTGNGICFKCPRNTFNNDTAGLCARCSRGYMTFSSGSTNCTSCREVAAATGGKIADCTASMSLTFNTKTITETFELTESSSQPVTQSFPNETSSQTLEQTESVSKNVSESYSKRTQTRSGESPTESVLRNSSTDSISVSNSILTETETFHHNSSSKSISESVQSETQTYSRHRVSNTTSLSQSLSDGEFNSSTHIATTSSEKTNFSVTESEATKSETKHAATETVSQTVEVFPPSPPMGLSSATQQALQETTGVVTAATAVVAGPAALSLANGIAVLKLIGCPARDHKGRKFDSVEVPFPASLIPGLSTGSEKGKFNRGAVISVAVMIGLVYVIGLLTQESVGSKQQKNNKKKKEKQNEKKLLLLSNGKQQQEQEQESNETNHSNNNNDKNMESALLSPKSSSENNNNNNNNNNEEDNESESDDEDDSSDDDDDDEGSDDDVIETATPSASPTRSNIEMNLQKQFETRKNIYTPTNAATNNNTSINTNESSSSSKKKKEEKRGPAKKATRIWLVYVCVNMFLGGMAPQSGIIFATLEPGDMFLALAPFLFVVLLHSYWSYKLHRSLNLSSGNYGVCFVPSFIVQQETTKKLSRKRAANVRWVKTFLESSLGRTCFLGCNFWSRQRGSSASNVEAQELLAALGGALQKFRGPKSIVDFISTANPFQNFESLRDFEECLEEKEDWEPEENPAVIRDTERSWDLCSLISPHYLLISWIFSFLIGFLQGFGLSHQTFCKTAAKLICGLNIMLFCVFLYLRPFVVPLRNYITIVHMFIIAIISAVTATILVSSETHHKRLNDVATSLQIICFCAGIITAISLLFISGVRMFFFMGLKTRVSSQEEAWAKRQFTLASLTYSQSSNKTTKRENFNNNNNSDPEDNAGELLREEEMVEKQKKVMSKTTTSPTSRSKNTTKNTKQLGRTLDEFLDELGSNENNNNEDKKTTTSERKTKNRKRNISTLL